MLNLTLPVLKHLLIYCTWNKACERMKGIPKSAALKTTTTTTTYNWLTPHPPVLTWISCYQVTTLSCALITSAIITSNGWRKQTKPPWWVHLKELYPWDLWPKAILKYEFIYIECMACGNNMVGNLIKWKKCSTKISADLPYMDIFFNSIKL